MNVITRTDIAIWISSVLASMCVFLLSGLRFSNDDQFILYRYIENIAAGNGFVYNLSERVLGATTPLFTLVASAVKFMAKGIATPDIVAYINILLIATAAVLFFRITQRFLSRPFALVAVAIFILNLSKVVQEGMETSLFLVMIFSFFLCFFADRHYPAAVFLALAVLTRPDAGLIAVMAGVYWLYTRGWKQTGMYTVVSIVTAMPWFVFATLYFGSFIPQSLITKLHSSDIYDLSTFQALKIQLAHVSRLFWGKIIDPNNVLIQSLVNLLPVVVLIGIGVWRKLDVRTWVFVFTPFAYLISFSISNPIIFPWYLSQTEPFWILLAFCGAEYLCSVAKRTWLSYVVILALIAGPAFFWVSNVLANDAGSKQGYFDIAREINNWKQPGDTVGITDIGIVGYQTELYVFDYIGLVNSFAVDFYPPQNECDTNNTYFELPSQIVVETMPNWLVMNTAHMDACFVGSSWFTAHYSPRYANVTATVWEKVAK